MNYEQVVEEDRRSKLPKNYDLKRKRQEWELEQLELKKVIFFPGTLDGKVLRNIGFLCSQKISQKSIGTVGALVLFFPHIDRLGLHFGDLDVTEKQPNA